MSYAIHVRPCYYAGTFGAPQPGCLRGADDRIVAVATRAEAEVLLRAVEPRGTYYLSHGEAGRPDYRVVPSRHRALPLGSAYLVLMTRALDDEHLDLIPDAIRALACACAAAAEAHGGGASTDLLTEADCEWIVSQLGFVPSRGDWADAGYGYVGGKHCSDE